MLKTHQQYKITDIIDIEICTCSVYGLVINNLYRHNRIFVMYINYMLILVVGCVNLSFAFVEGESLLMALKDIALSSGR